jgi:hypothetical protein
MLFGPPPTSAEETPDDPIFESPLPRNILEAFTIRQRSELVAKCPALKTDEQMRTGNFRLFAEYEASGVYIAIIDNGNVHGISMQRSGTCYIEPAQFALKGTSAKIVLSDKEMEGLYFDVLNRYAVAFGSKDSFLQWLDFNMAEYDKYCNGRGLPRWMCNSGYADMTPSQMRAIERFKN